MLHQFKKKLIQLLKNKEYKPLIENFTSLSGLQIAGYVLPLITLPYLVRVLGPDKYGLIAFAGAFITYFQILTDYGFNLSATREIAIHRENKEKVSEIFSSVMLIKVILAVLSLIALSLIVFIIPQFESNWQIYFLTFGILIGNVLFPIWFFQGMEKMKYITILSILSQIIFTISIFIFIRNASDYLYVPLINSLGFIFAGILGLRIVFKEFDVKLILPSYNNLKFQLIEGWHVFISTVAISLYTNTNTFILGIFTNNVIVGYFAAGEKIIRAAQSIYGPLYQSTYPYISKLASVSKLEALKFLKKTAIVMFILTFSISIILFFGADVIVKILLGSEFSESVIVVRILAFLPLIIGMATIYANLFLLAFRFTKTWSKIILFSGAYSILGALIFLWIFNLGLIGICINIVITEMIILILSFVTYNKEKEQFIGD